MEVGDVDLWLKARPIGLWCIRDWDVNVGWIVFLDILRHEVGGYEPCPRPPRCVTTSL